MSSLVNFTLYQTGWFAIVLGAARHRPWLGMAFASALVLVHLALIHGSCRHLALILASGAIGFVLDSLQLRLGVFRFSSGMISPALAPPWDAILWMQFATILPFCLRWLSRHYLLCCLLGATGGPLAFYTGEQLGAVDFLAPRPVHFTILGGVWALAFPSLVWLSDKLVTEPGLGGSYRFVTAECGVPTCEDEF